MPNRHKRGMILFIVIGIIMVAVVLSTVMLRIISSQARLTHHQVSRIQAQYAAKAGVLYALDKLRRSNSLDPDFACWPPNGTYMHRLLRSGSATFVFPNCVFIDSTLPSTIQSVEITVGIPGSGPSGTRKVSAKAIYTPQ